METSISQTDGKQRNERHLCIPSGIPTERTTHVQNVLSLVLARQYIYPIPSSNYPSDPLDSLISSPPAQTRAYLSLSDSLQFMEEYSF